MRDPRKVTFIDIDDPFGLAGKHRPIHTMSKLSWVSDVDPARDRLGIEQSQVACGGHRFILDFLGG